MPKIFSENEDKGEVTIEGYVVEGFILDEKCDCGAQKVYFENYDAKFCPEENKWLENHCSDPLCDYCKSRPKTPLPNINVNLHETHILGYAITSPQEEDFYPQFSALIDGIKEPHSLLLVPLEISAQKDGVYPILNCGCREWGCGGFYVQVRNTEEYVIWEQVYGLMNQQKPLDVLHTKTPIYFKREEYTALIKKLLEEKERFKYEKNIYLIDLEQYQKHGMNTLYNLK